MSSIVELSSFISTSFPSVDEQVVLGDRGQEEMSTDLQSNHGEERNDVSVDGAQNNSSNVQETDAKSGKNTNSPEKDGDGAVINEDPAMNAEVEPSSDNQQVDTHKQKEAELEAYLESLKPKPKRKSIKEMLMSLPGYKDLKAIKPKIGGGNGKKDDVIILDDESNSRRKSRDLKRQQQIEALKDRFVRHCITAPPKSGKGEHVKLKIKKKEEDSQGIEHLVENEVDYIRNPLNEEEEAVSFLSSPQSISPQAAPGASRRRIQETLMEKIRARKLKEHEERVKDYKMYNDENDGKDEASEDEEIVEDEEMSEVDSDAEEDEEEEDLEKLLNNSSKKKRKSAFIDDEAEDEDNDDDDDDDDDSVKGDSEDSDSTEEEDEKDQVDVREDLKDEKNTDDLASIGASEDSVSAAQTSCDKIAEISTPVKSVIMNDDSQKSLDYGIDFTPKVTTAVLNQEFKRTPSDLWIPAKSNLNCRQTEDLSPTIPRINKSVRSEECTANLVPKSLANVISEHQPQFNDLVELCSGRFVSQANTGLTDSQEEDEFSGFDFGDDEEMNEKTGDGKDDQKTPKADTSRTAVDGVTPKLCERVPKTRLLMQFDEEAEKTEKENLTKETGQINSLNDPEDDEEEIISIRKKGRKQKRLQFSDDEDDGLEEAPSNSQSGDEQSMESELEEEDMEEASPEIVQAKPVSKGLFFNKHGQLKRKFVEDEAELSGSEEGSDDEDEKGLNDYEMEEADEEEMDEEAEKHKVERAHLKHLLDDDDKEIRLLQNKYLESGDLTSKQRERKFTWKMNINELNDDAHFGDSDEDQADDTPEDTTLKQAWIEKRKWMSENSHLLEADEDESQSLLNNSRFLNISKSTIKKLELFVDTSTSESSNVIIKETSVQRRSIYEDIIKTRSAAKKENDVTTCSEGMNISSDTNDAAESNKSMSQPLFGETTWTKSSVGSKKGSFLSRGGMMLAKLAEGSKPGDAVSNIKSNSRNFVFQHITPPNPEKTDGSTSRVKRGPLKSGNKAATKKIKIDRSFSNLDEASKGASIFKYF